MKRRTTKNALAVSVLSLVLCVSMLVGTTFAWFTDSVTSGVNQIVAGNLDVDVYYGDPADENSIDGVSTLFNDVTRWEPGAVAYENLTVANKGTLALKYQMTVSFGNENYVMVDGEAAYGLSDILLIAMVPGGVDETLTREQLIASIPESDWAPIDNFEISGELLAKTNEEPVGLVIWWAPSDGDNNWNVNNGKETSDLKDHLHIEFGINLVATQYTHEEDSFDENYDLHAAFPEVPSAWLPEGKTVSKGAITVIVPKGAPMGEYDIDVTKFTKTVDQNDHAVIDMDFTLTRDGTPVEPGSAVYTVIIAGNLMSDGHVITHNGELVKNYKYDMFYNGILFTTTSFSPFTVEYDIFGKEVVVDAQARTIQGGYFKKVNPATIDGTLLGDSTEYIAVDYVNGGVKRYAVSKRATTVILDDGQESQYTFENGDYSALVKPNMNGQLHNVVTNLRGNAHSTVYILPGTYNQASTVYIRSDMDIVGLGDAQDIKIYKTLSSDSNRHLLNVTGSEGTEYVDVTIRNLYLNATTDTKDKKKDNAAVQAIDLAKVKCYNLIVEKEKDPTNKSVWSENAAFYVNGSGKAGAYLYVENTTVSSTYVLSTKAPYRFYYSDLQTKNGVGSYTNSTSYVKNLKLEWNDWDW